MKDEFLREQGYGEPSPDAEASEQIVERVLGDSFGVEYGTFPKNVGLKGDGRHYGDTVMLTTDSDTPAKTFGEHYDEVEETASQIMGSTDASKVLVDVTPLYAIPRFLPEDRKKEAVPFVDMVKNRLEGYVLLRRKYYDQLDGDTDMQTAVWTIMNVIDATFRAKMSRQFAEEIRNPKKRERQMNISESQAIAILTTAAVLA